MKKLEATEIRGLSIGRAVTYLVSIILGVAGFAMGYQKLINSFESLKRENIIQQEQIEAGVLEMKDYEIRMRNMELKITILETKINSHE